tara:strand:- start:664 stop:804 length:141 start_codon:yes stop_codon:yes gene_type:complete
MRNPSITKVRVPMINPGKKAQISGIPMFTEIPPQGECNAWIILGAI